MSDTAEQPMRDASCQGDPVTYMRIFKTWLPLGITQFLMSAEDPFYVAVIMRLQYPKLELGALYSYMWPILLLISSAVFTLNTVGNVYATNIRNLRRIQTMSFLLGLFLTLTLIGIAFTPLREFLLFTLMAVPDTEFSMAVTALQICTIYPVVAAMNYIYQGILIRGGHASHILVARCIRFGVGLVVLLVGLQTGWLGGAALGAMAIMLSLLLQTLYLSWKSRKCTQELNDNPLEEAFVRVSALIKFTIPLAITPILMSISGLVMAAAIGRLPAVVVSLAVWPVVTNFSNIGMWMGNSYNQVAVKHYESHADRDKLFRFGLILGVALSGITMLFIISGLFDYALINLENLDPNTARISINAMWFLAPLPFFYTMNALYSGLLSKTKKTMPILISQLIALVIVVLMLLATINLDPFMGVYVVSASSVVAMAVAMLWVWYAWRKKLHHIPAGM